MYLIFGIIFEVNGFGNYYKIIRQYINVGGYLMKNGMILSFVLGSVLFLTACNEDEAQVTAEESQAIEMVEYESNEAASTDEQEVTYKKVQVYDSVEYDTIEFKSEVTYSSTYGSFEEFVFLQNGVGAFYGSHTISEDGKTFMLDIPKSTLEDPFYVGGTANASINARMLEYAIFANMLEIETIQYYSEGEPTDGWSDLELYESDREQFEQDNTLYEDPYPWSLKK